MARRKRPTQPEDLLVMLVDSVMARLSPNAWTVVSYIASQHMRVQDDFFLRRANPAVFYLNRDIKQMTGIDMDDTVKVFWGAASLSIRWSGAAMCMLDAPTSALCGPEPRADLLQSAGEGPVAGPRNRVDQKLGCGGDQRSNHGGHRYPPEQKRVHGRRLCLPLRDRLGQSPGARLDPAQDGKGENRAPQKSSSGCAPIGQRKTCAEEPKSTP